MKHERYVSWLSVHLLICEFLWSFSAMSETKRQSEVSYRKGAGSQDKSLLHPAEQIRCKVNSHHITLRVVNREVLKETISKDKDNRMDF